MTQRAFYKKMTDKIIQKYKNIIDKSQILLLRPVEDYQPRLVLFELPEFTSGKLV